jgi:glycosyltransferase involved in cell wall biosynthesis
MKPRVCLVVGDTGTEHCGVKDYAIRLKESLAQIGLSAEVLAPKDWGMTSFLRFCKELRDRQFDVIHIQYPSIGNRGSLGPHSIGLMRLAKGVVVTLHEYSALSRPQRMSTHLFRFTSDQLVFTVDTEMANYGRSNIKQRVVHIGSNVPASLPNMPRNSTVVYFGQIRPGKGIEEFLDLARYTLDQGKPFNYLIIGSVPKRRADYYHAVRSTADPQVEWLIDLQFEQVSQIMASSLAAYLPFPDGATYRRGSLLATLTNGLPTITKVGPATPHDMLEIILPAANSRQALAHLEHLRAFPSEASALNLGARRFAEKFSWIEIARQHEQIYIEALSHARHFRRSDEPFVSPLESRDNTLSRHGRNGGPVG